MRPPAVHVRMQLLFSSFVLAPFTSIVASLTSHAYGAHSVATSFNKLNHLVNKINQFCVFNKIIM